MLHFVWGHLSWKQTVLCIPFIRKCWTLSELKFKMSRNRNRDIRYLESLHPPFLFPSFYLLQVTAPHTVVYNHLLWLSSLFRTLNLKSCTVNIELFLFFHILRLKNQLREECASWQCDKGSSQLVVSARAWHVLHITAKIITWPQARLLFILLAY